MSIIHVRAVGKRRIPREGLPTEVIGNESVAVHDSHYYRTHISEGTLEVVDPAPTQDIDHDAPTTHDSEEDSE